MRGRTAWLLAIIGWVLPAACAYGADVELSLRYGGTTSAPYAVVQGAFEWFGKAGGSFLVGGDLYGPGTWLGVRPAATYEYHWTGGDDTQTLRAESHHASVGAMRPFKIGYAVAQVLLLGTRYVDSYDVWARGASRHVYTDASWGITAGVDLRFRFLERVDSIVGYRFDWRERARFESSGPLTERSHTGLGFGTEHSIFAGLAFGLGGV